VTDSKRKPVLDDEVLQALYEVEFTPEEAEYLKGMNTNEALGLLNVKKSLGGVIGGDILVSSPSSDVPPSRHNRKVRVCDLKPSSVNGVIWAESLEAESIEALARDIDEHGLRQMIEVNEDLAILDGERRGEPTCRGTPNASSGVDLILSRKGS